MEEIEIPTHFLCPISLQLMKDPVILSTGITYDRDTIDKWLFSCKNNTCPITKQIVSDSDSDPDLTPNHTLRRLIQAWCTLNSSCGIERIPTPKPPISIDEIASLIDEAESANSPEIQLNSLKKLKSIAMESERNKISFESAGGIKFLISIIRISSDFSIIEEALSVIYQLKVSEKYLKNFVSNDGGIFESLIRILNQGSYQSRAYATMLLKNALQVSDPIQLITVRSEFFAEIVRVLRDRISNQSTKAALKILVELCPWGRNRVKAVGGGAITVLIDLLLETSEKRDCELMMSLLDQICGCAEGRAELVNHAAGIAVVSKKILRVSHLVSDRAVRILSSICKYSATPRVVREMLEVGVVAKLCLVLQVDCGNKTKEKAREILKMHSRVWRCSSCIPNYLLDSLPSSPDSP